MICQKASAKSDIRAPKWIYDMRLRLLGLLSLIFAIAPRAFAQDAVDPNESAQIIEPADSSDAAPVAREAVDEFDDLQRRAY